MSRYEFATNDQHLHYVVNTSESIVGTYPYLKYRVAFNFQYYCLVGPASMYYNNLVSKFHTAELKSNVSFNLGTGQYSGVFGNGVIDLPWGSARSVAHTVGTGVSAYFSGSGNVVLPTLTIETGNLSASLVSIGEQSCVIKIDYSSPFNYYYARIYNVTDKTWAKSPADNGNNTITGLRPGESYTFHIELWGRDGKMYTQKTLNCKTIMPIANIEAFTKEIEHDSCVVNVSLTNNNYSYWYCKIYDEVSKKYVIDKTINGDNLIRNLKAGTDYKLRVEMWAVDGITFAKQIILEFKTIGISYVANYESDYIDDPIVLHINSYNDSFTNRLTFKIENQSFYSIGNFTTSGLKYDVLLKWSNNQIEQIYELARNSSSAICSVIIETFEKSISLGTSEFSFSIFKKPPSDFIWGSLADGENILLPLPFLPKGIIVEMPKNPSTYFGGQWIKIFTNIWQQIEYEPNQYSRQRLQYTLGRPKEFKS